MRYLLLISALCLTASAHAAPFEKGDANKGKILADKQCVACHISMYKGDGSSVYTRADRKVKSAAQLAARVAGCNLLVCDRDELYWWSTTARQKLLPGVYGVSNSPWPDEWPKVQRLKAAYADLAAAPEEALIDGLFQVLRDRAPRATGALDLARLEETLFVLSPTYGTRCSTIVLRTHRGELCLVERSFDRAGDLTGERRFKVPNSTH